PVERCLLMRSVHRPRILVLLFYGAMGALSVAGPVLAGQQQGSTDSPIRPVRRSRMTRRANVSKTSSPKVDATFKEAPTVDLLDGVRTGKVAVDAEGSGDGRITL